MDDLHDAASEETKVSSGRPDLRSVRDEYRAGEVADHAGAKVDHPDTFGSGHLLQVPH